MTKGARECLRGGGHRTLAIVPIGLPDHPLGRLLAPHQPYAVNHPSQTAHRKGSARIAEKVNPVARPILAGQPPISPGDLAVDATPLHKAKGAPHPLPLQALFVIDPPLHAPLIAKQKLQHQPRIGLIPRLQE